MVYGSENVKNVNEETIDYLAGCKPSFVTPSYASIDEMVYYVIEANERDYNDMMMSIGIDELHHLEETGTEMIYESDSKDGKASKFIERAKQMLTDLWTNIQGMISSAIKTLDEKAQSFKKSVIDKLGGNKIKEKATKIPADKDFGESYNYAKLEANKGLVAIWTDAAYDADIAIMTAEAAAVSSSDVSELDDKCKSIIDDFRSKLPGAKESSSIKKAMIDTIRGEKKKYTGATIRTEFKTMFDEVVKFPKAKRELKKNYNDCKKVFNAAIANLKVDKFKSKNIPGKKNEFLASACSTAIKYMKQALQYVVYAQQATITCLNERNRFYMSVVLKVIGSKKNKEDKKETSNHESAMIGTYDRIASLFEW